MAGGGFEVREARAYVSWMVRLLQESARRCDGRQSGLFPFERVIFDDRTGFILEKTAGAYLDGSLSLRRQHVL